VATSLEWIVFPLCDWLGNDLYVAAQAGGIWVGLGKLAVEPDWVVPGELREPASDLFVNLRSDGAGGTLAGHNPLLNAAGEVAIRIAIAFVDDTLESRAIPTHVEITVVHRTSSVTVGEDEWLIRVFGLGGLVIETRGVVVHLVEDTGKVNREVSRAVTAVRPSAAVGDVGFMVG